jgi:hypothetical protein
MSGRVSARKKASPGKRKYSGILNIPGASQLNRNRTIAETLERQVMSKHRLNHIYCCPKLAKKEFLERHNKKDWSAEQDRDDLALWGQQKREYLTENPTHRALFDELVGGATTAEGEAEGVITVI